MDNPTSVGAYAPQAAKEEYFPWRYIDHDRWNSFWYQIKYVGDTKPESVLEVGPGLGVVSRELRMRGLAVTTLDIAGDLQPDLVGSVTEIPAAAKSFDTILAAEILEHIKMEDVLPALKEFVRVGKKSVVVSVPRPGYVFSVLWKFPLIRRKKFVFKIPFFWETHHFNGQHYWELGKKGMPVSWFVGESKKAGLVLQEQAEYPDDPAHIYFLFSITG